MELIVAPVGGSATAHAGECQHPPHAGCTRSTGEADRVILARLPKSAAPNAA